VGKYTKKVKCDFVTSEYTKSTSNHYIFITTVHTYFIQLWIFGCACDLSIYHLTSL